MTYSGYEGIYIEQNDVPGSGLGTWTSGGYGPQFFTQCIQDLTSIASRPLGKDLLDLIAKRHQGIGTKAAGRTITIKPQYSSVNKTGGVTGPAAGATEAHKFRQGNYGDRIRMPGRGLSCTVRYAAFMTDGTNYKKAHQGAPSFITLAHELIHALHYLSGNVEQQSVITDKGQEVRREEMLTTGLGPYANTRLSENTIRAEHKLSRREYYTFPGDHKNIPGILPAAPELSFCSWLWAQYEILRAMGPITIM
jgi:hypothetical protein